ncbi:26417_t:CDS:2, partial [Dentiscutata erythropus]
VSLVFLVAASVVDIGRRRRSHSLMLSVILFILLAVSSFAVCFYWCSVVVYWCCVIAYSSSTLLALLCFGAF